MSIFFADSARANGGYIGRSYTTLFDPNFGSLEFGLFGNDGPASAQSAPITTNLLTSSFNTSGSPWVGQTGSSLWIEASAELGVNSAAGYLGAIYTQTGLTPGHTVVFRGKGRGGNGYAITALDGSALTTIDSYETTTTTQTSFSRTFTVPASGSIRFGLLNRVGNQPAYFDDVVIDVTSPASSTATTFDVTGKMVTWTGNAVVNTTRSKYYDKSIQFTGGRLSATLRNFGSGDCIFECDVFLNGTSGTTRGIFMNNIDTFSVSVTSAGAWSIWDGTTGRTGGTATFGTWNRVRFAQVGGLSGLMVNGSSVITPALKTYNLDTGTFHWGVNGTTFQFGLNGSMQDILVYRGHGDLSPYTPNTRGYMERARRWPGGIWRV